MESLAVKAAGIDLADSTTHLDSPNRTDDLEAGHGIRRSGSRASLPAAQQLSVRSRSPAGAASSHRDERRATDDEADRRDEYAWGPSHPCYPHLNPHVPASSPLAASTRIIRVKRDWMIAGDLAPTFANLYPEILDPLLPEETFRELVEKINAEVTAAFSPWSGRAWADALLGVVTLWLWEDLGLTGVKSRLEALERWIERWNAEVGAKDGVAIIPLRRTAYMTVSFLSRPP